MKVLISVYESLFIMKRKIFFPYCLQMNRAYILLFFVCDSEFLSFAYNRLIAFIHDFMLSAHSLSFYNLKLQLLVRRPVKIVEHVCRIIHASVAKSFVVNNVNLMLMYAHQRRLILTVRTVVVVITTLFVASFHVRKEFHFLAHQPMSMFVNMKTDTSYLQLFHDAITVSFITLKSFFSSPSKVY